MLQRHAGSKLEVWVVFDVIDIHRAVHHPQLPPRVRVGRVHKVAITCTTQLPTWHLSFNASRSNKHGSHGICKSTLNTPSPTPVLSMHFLLLVSSGPLGIGPPHCFVVVPLSSQVPEWSLKYVPTLLYSFRKAVRQGLASDRNAGTNSLHTQNALI